MFLLLLAASLLVRRSASADVEGGLTGWYEPPNFRGTWDLILSCVLTLTICVWSALHLNVPTEESRLRDRNVRRLRWILLGIFAPELVVSTAFAQYLTAKWLQREIRKDVTYRKENGTDPRWSAEQQLREFSTTQCYFAVMGGVRIETGDCIAGNPRLNLTAEGIRLMSFLGRLPDVPENQIADKSKADGLAKTLVVLQAGWMIIQTIARVNQGLPVTLLEINTMGHVICAFALYALWWSKPLDIKDPTLVRREEWMDKFVSVMWMCSPICWQSPTDFISEIRCMNYTPPSQRGDSPITSTVETIEEKPKTESKSNKPHKTHFSIGSIGALDPKKFIGPLEKFEVDGDAHDMSYVIHGASFRIATEHDIFLRLQQSHHGLRHSLSYCRRALKDCDKHDILPKCAIERWRLANILVDDLWAECEKRPEYRAFFFTTSSLGIFVGELIYIADHVPNFPGLSYLGSVNVHRDILKSILAFAGSAYGGLHLSAWNDFFPTQVERWMWIACSLATGATGVVLALFFLATQRIKAFENLEHWIRGNRVVMWALASVLTPLFMVARVFIVVEAFCSLRRQPEAVYKTPEWANYLPHL
ncbi:hypothetical protein K458DRAFT_85623 [Lentithecium fluviatile CBS 122367]|uniref:Uncharacterized protein n=1 Tax=Lentithecium fluviatile CBS 122367 TaxID=1168545 RepID=A0A6G1IS17_9PLEO|nr:hypothetical protein K458DRAFT_85623 [Lentithecium fluviatile CBS 122367]